MATVNEMRASDADREMVVQALQEQVGLGRLTLAEFEERSGQVYTAKTIADLRAITHDLPIEPLARPVDSWQSPFGMPVMSPWMRRSMQQGRLEPNGLRRRLPPNFPMRRVGPLAVVAAVLFTVFIVSAIVHIAVGAVFFFPWLPLMFLLFAVLRFRGRGFR
jgi:hypothetical protein